MGEKNKNTGLIITLIFFIIVSIGLAGYICYDKLINNKEDNIEVKSKKNNQDIETFSDNVSIKNSEIQKLYNYVQPSLKSNDVCLGYFYQNPYKKHTLTDKVSLVLINYTEKYQKKIDNNFLQRIDKKDRETVKYSSQYYIEASVVKEGLKLLFNIEVDKFDNNINYSTWSYRDDVNAFVSGNGGGAYQAEIVQQIINYNELEDEINLTVAKAELRYYPETIMDSDDEKNIPAGIYRYVNNPSTLVYEGNVEDFKFTKENINKFPQLKYIFKKNNNGKYYVSDIINLNYEEDFVDCNK